MARQVSLDLSKMQSPSLISLKITDFDCLKSWLSLSSQWNGVPGLSSLQNGIMYSVTQSIPFLVVKSEPGAHLCDASRCGEVWSHINVLFAWAHTLRPSGLSASEVVPGCGGCQTPHWGRPWASYGHASSVAAAGAYTYWMCWICGNPWASVVGAAC